jgi:hypothetical protein
MKKLILLIFTFLLITSTLHAANARTGNKATPNSALNYEQVVVDTDPGANGYFTLPISVQDLPEEYDELWFTVETITGATVHLQWARCTTNTCSGATWIDDGDGPYTAAANKVIHDATKSWRTGVKDNNQGTTSTSTIMWRKKR